MDPQTNPYHEIAADVEQIVHRMGGNDWETGSEYELADRLLTAEDKEQLRKAQLLAELSAEYLQRITLSLVVKEQS